MTEDDLKPVIKEAEVINRTLLDQLREGLRTDPRVYVAGEIIDSNAGVGWTETVSIIVAPKDAEYDPEKLNRFMDSLIPDIERSSRDGASQYTEESDFQLGRLYFDEDIGKVTRSITESIEFIDPNALERSKIQPGTREYTEEEDLKRRTWVRVYPDSTLAFTVHSYEQAVREGKVQEASEDLGYAEHWLSPGIISEARRSAKGNRVKKFLGLGRKNSI